MFIKNKLGENSWSSNEATTLKFENGKIHIAAGISTNYILTYDYTITNDGMVTYYDDVNYFEDPEFTPKYRYIHFNSSNADFMEVCYFGDDSPTATSGCSENTKNHEVLFWDHTKATNALGNSNFFDYIPAPL